MHEIFRGRTTSGVAHLITSIRMILRVTTWPISSQSSIALPCRAWQAFLTALAEA
jgi:hypothetical protein